MTEFFKDCGNLINVKLLRGKAFVKFSTQESQEKALALDQTDMNGRPLRIETPKNRMQFAQDRSDKTARHKWDQDDVFEAFIGNVSFDSTEQELNEFFGQCGNLINVKLLRGKAFVKFSTQESLDKAVALNGSDVSGRNLRIEAAAKRNSGPKTDRDPESTTVFVGGLYYYTNEAKLKEVFDHCGEVLDIRMPLNEDQSAVIFLFSFCQELIFLESWICPCRVCVRGCRREGYEDGWNSSRRQENPYGLLQLQR